MSCLIATINVSRAKFDMLVLNLMGIHVFEKEWHCLVRIFVIPEKLKWKVNETWLKKYSNCYCHKSNKLT